MKTPSNHEPGNVFSFILRTLRQAKGQLWASLNGPLNLDGSQGKTKHDVTACFPLFRPYSSGAYKSIAPLTIKSINETMPLLRVLVESLGYKKVETVRLDTFLTAQDRINSAQALKQLLDKYHSDKGSVHNYYILYSFILANRNQTERVFEIGLGTNNLDVVSNMGAAGRPGASLRAFKDFLVNADIYGADVDRRVLFDEDRIKTYFVDQLDQSTFDDLGTVLPDDFDLMIDDGLHSPNANLRSLQFFLPKLKVGGWAVIEDIADASLPVWETVGAVLPVQYHPTIFKGRAGHLFAVQRIS